MKFAVAGVSGNTGKAAAETLLALGHQVRVIVRDAAKGEPWRAKGAEVALADLRDVGALATALEGVDGAYLLVPPLMAPGFRAWQAEVGGALVAAAEAARANHVVFLSSIGAQHPAGTGPVAGLYPVEKALRASVAEGRIKSATFLRAGYFMENLAGSLGALEQGILPGFMPVDLPIDMIASRDIGRVAAELLAQGGQGLAVVELGGPAVTLNDAAAALTEIVGRPIAAIQAPLEQMVPTLTGFGIPLELAELYAELAGAITSGHIAWEGTGRRVLGTTPVAQVLRGVLGR
jgi:uncharacterized protein YbjT (DUF2867 family)